jgi:hypothetical protein
LRGNFMFAHAYHGAADHLARRAPESHGAGDTVAAGDLLDFFRGEADAALDEPVSSYPFERPSPYRLSLTSVRRLSLKKKLRNSQFAAPPGRERVHLLRQCRSTVGSVPRPKSLAQALHGRGSDAAGRVRVPSRR